MDKKINILVFPCGSEVALEIHRSLKFSRHINLIGASSVDDHGKFVFENYIGEIPFISEDGFIEVMKSIVIKHKVDAIYPAMDSAITTLKRDEKYLGCQIISSDLKTSEICLSKVKTYKELCSIIKTPIVYSKIDEIKDYPVFAKPSVGYGSRGAKKIENYEGLKAHLQEWKDCVITEFLNGPEYTVDCFTNRHRELLFVGPRLRKRVKNGISVNTSEITKGNRNEFIDFASKINDTLNLRGAWFYQVKRNSKGELVLLEVASRLGGSSSLYRLKGINFALLSIFDAFNIEVEILENDTTVVVDRALDIRFKIECDFQNVYVDFDDCIIINGEINYQLVGQLYKFLNQGKQLILITKHSGDIKQALTIIRLNDLFDKIIHLKAIDQKYKFIEEENSIFIDDSHMERKQVFENLGIPVFSPDMMVE
ncbi:ATP-grasp domain-containing protein [Robiginitalea sp. IMCC43444]|uniref:ATP-grasp domain-containing protein n=1 Tax=Robiginitalea sp. IMCC43444 TaxID=3459121 RepID=UPI0040431729